VILDDQLLLQRYAASRDAEAFALLVGRYSSMVYSVACRVTGNMAAAEDITQDCFLTLARQAAAIRGSLPAWLHRVALNRSLEIIRNDTTRQRREAKVSASKPAGEATWREMMPVVDAALAELPQELREPLVQRFLLGRSQVQIAEALGVNQATVSRRIAEGIERLRGHLRRTGFICGVIILSAGLAESASAAVPARLTTSLAKMAMAGPAKAATAGTITTVLSANAKIIAAIAAAIVGVGTVSYHFVPKMGLWGTTVTRPNTKPMPYLSELSLKGDMLTQDSFSLAFQAAAKVCGREVDYDTVYALSTNAFCPAVARKLQGHKAFWHVQAFMGDKAINTLGRRYGIAVTSLDQGDAGSRPATGTFSPEIAKAMNAGSVVLVTSPWAGIVTDVQPDGSMFGATLDGQTDNLIGQPSGIWVLSPGTETMTPHEADMATLQSAIARIWGKGPYQTTQQSEYGLMAMDEWIKAMNKIPGFCTCSVCQASVKDPSKRRGNSVYQNVSVTQTASKTAASYLRRIAGDFPAGARSYIESAAAHYDRIIALLAPSIETGPDSYETFIGDITKQRVYAKMVLVPVKAEYVAIAKDLELALNAK
jgi:RNA polymerase sigma factor (sigma-70 family)